MPKLNRVYSKISGKLSVTILSFFFLAEGFAGDLKFSIRYRFNLVEQYKEQPVAAEIENVESFPVDGVTLKFTIRNKLSLDVAYQYEMELGTIPPNSMQTVKAPDPWIAQMTGNYRLSYELNSLNDINPENDTTSYDVEVVPAPGFSYKFNQLHFLNPFQQENSNTGRIDFKVPPSETIQYVNFMFSSPNPSLPPQWLVQNLPLPAFPDTQEISYWIDLEKIGIQNGVDVSLLSYNYRYGTEPLLQPFEDSGMFLSDVGKDTYNVGGDNPVEWEYKPSLSIPGIKWDNNFEVKTWNYRGCTVPNIDLDSSVYNPRDIEGEVGDWNSCGPASAVNSLQWLENTNDNIPKTDKTHREKLDIFNKVSNRANENGLNTRGIIEGKLAFIDSLKLPIHVKWQGVPYDSTIASPNTKYEHFAESKNDSVGAHCTFDWLVSEIEKGEDVEIKFGWYDTLNVRHGGHWVVVSGVSDVTTAQGLYVKDDQYQEKSGGMRQTYLNWVTDENGRPRLVGFKGKNNRCWVESVVSESYDSTITFGIGEPEIKKVNVDEGPANWYNLKGLFEFTFPASETAKYLNVFAAGRGSTDQPEWILKNLLLPPFSEDQMLSAWFDFSWLGFAPGDQVSEIDIGYEVSTDIADFESTSYQGSMLTFPVDEERMNISLNFNNRPNIDIITPPNRLPAFELEPYKTWEYRGCTVPNIDLDSTTYNPTTEAGYAGDKNACGPAGAANSMQWLENKYDQINTNTTHREKLKELSGFMNRADNSTVSDENFVKGKLAFIDKYKLPIRVKMQGIFFGSDSITSPNANYGHYADNKNDTSNAYPQWDWLVDEMKDDEDVEIGIAWYDSTGRSLGGHWVTASGVSEVGSYRGLYIKDDGNQKTAGGTKQQFTNVDTTDGGKPYLPQLSSDNSICMLEAVVSESYDSTVTFIPVSAHEISANNKLNLKVFQNPGSRNKPVNINFDITEPGKIQLIIFEISGRRIFLKSVDYGNPGNKTIIWNPNNSEVNDLGVGTYFVKVISEQEEATVRLILIE